MSQKKIKIYTKQLCPFFMKAKMLLKSQKVNFEEIEVKSEKDFETLSKKTGLMTVPQIFIGGKLIGGCDDLFTLKDEGKLKDLLSA